jgi:hypothetical protein
MRILKITAATMLLSGVLLAGNTLAQTENVAETTVQASDTATTTAEPTLTSANTDAAVQNSVSTPEPQTKIPGAWGLFWLGLRERVSVALTLDPVKKAEKLVDFANQRMNIAEAAAEKAKDNPALQDQAEKMMARANELMQRVTERKDELLKKGDTKAADVLNQVGAQMVHRAKVLDRIQERLGDVQKIKDLRDQAEKDGNSFLDASSTPGIPPEIRAHLEEVRSQIMEQRDNVKQFVEQKKDLLEKIKAGDEQAKEDLKKLQEDFVESRPGRIEDRKIIRDEIKDIRKDIRDQINATSSIREEKEMRLKLRPLDTSSTIPMERKELRQEIKKDRVEIRQDIRDIRRLPPEGRKDGPEAKTEVKLDTQVTPESSDQ